MKFDRRIFKKNNEFFEVKNDGLARTKISNIYEYDKTLIANIEEFTNEKIVFVGIAQFNANITIAELGASDYHIFIVSRDLSIHKLFTDVDSFAYYVFVNYENDTIIIHPNSERNPELLDVLCNVKTRYYSKISDKRDYINIKNIDSLGTIGEDICNQLNSEEKSKDIILLFDSKKELDDFKSSIDAISIYDNGRYFNNDLYNVSPLYKVNNKYFYYLSGELLKEINKINKKDFNYHIKNVKFGPASLLMMSDIIIKDNFVYFKGEKYVKYYTNEKIELLIKIYTNKRITRKFSGDEDIYLFNFTKERLNCINSNYDIEYSEETNSGKLTIKKEEN